MNGATWVRIGAILGALAVAAGAFGAHGLKPTKEVRRAMSPEDGQASDRRLENFETGARYHMYHALAIVGLGAVALHASRRNLLNVAGWIIVAGTAMFSGSLYVIGAGGPGWLGVAVTPFGGVLLILGWCVFAAGLSEASKAGSEGV